ncbi:response regulator transcription factor [Pedobacter jejuensis]|uniref:DNA-binding response regulator n=1 Tax=Pedobacter jejuensis TaxID=1268550 RepID=A0A3N0BRK7_9SPHI|nr:response regulator transcription factor [Pedobacter jejuensis]RNL51295.1 DNA-binding response regulator [Pedobacter jejuensis]
MKTIIKVLLAEDHTIVRNGIVALLDGEPEIKIIAEARNGSEVLQHLRSGIEPDVIITDINMPDTKGVELISILNANFPNIKVLVLSVLDDEKNISQAIDAGASGYLLKTVDIDTMIFAIKQITLGNKYICTNISLKLLAHINRTNNSNRTPLKSNVEVSKREIEILKLIAQGYTNSEIADKLFTSKRTIEGNRQNLLDKTGTKNTASLINFVVRNRIID